MLYLKDASNVHCIILKRRLIDGIFAWKRGCSGNNELKQMALSAMILSRGKIAEFLTNLNRRNARIYKTYLCLDGRYIYLLFEECHQEKKICLYPDIGQSFEESTRGDKLVKYLDIFV